ncbi:hypothetical protein N9287_02340 [Candidatus Pelagibacter sp.]|jgi:hypothetical protein|nr:hypothetical protein [Candidatus Pelagibacter sp.]
MLSDKIKECLNEYISQEVYVQVAVAKGKNKISTNAAISKYFETNHFKGLTAGKPYNTFLDDLKDKCLGKLLNSPMKDSKTEDKIIIELKRKLNTLKIEELNNTYWEVETGEYLSGEDIKEIELERDTLIKFLISKDEAHDTVSTLCKNYEKLCKEKYPEAPLPLEIL